MRNLTLPLVLSALALSACHPTNTPATQGTLDPTAAAVTAGSAPAGPNDGVRVSDGPSSAPMRRMVSRTMAWMSTYAVVVISPMTTTKPVVVATSQATRAFGS